MVLNEKDLTDKKWVAIIATLCCLLWGSAYPGVKIGYTLFFINHNDIAAKILFAGYRFVLAGVIILIIARKLGKKIGGFTKNNFAFLGLLGMVQTTIQYIFFYIGISNTTGVKGSVMNSMSTFFSVILAHYIYKHDKLTKRRTIGCIIGFLGVVAVNFNSQLWKLSFSFMGDGFLVIASLVFSLAAIYSKKLIKSMDVMIVTGYSLFIGGIILVVLGMIFGARIEHFTVKAFFMLIYLASLSSIAFSLWNLLLKYNNVGLVSVYIFLIPIFGSILSAIFLGEAIWEIKNIIALILVCIGIRMVNTEPLNA